MNKLVTWAKEHPAIAASVVAGIALVIYLLSRSGSGGSSLAGTIATSQAQNEALATQNAQTNAALQANENQTALAAQVENNKTAAALAATVANFQAQNNADIIAANVQTDQTDKQAQIESQYISAASAADKSRIDAESAALTNEIGYMEFVNNNTTTLTQDTLNKLVKGGSTLDYNTQLNATLALGTGQPGAVSPLTSGAAAIDYGYNASQASQVQSVVSGIAAGLKTLFA